ncbi:MAG: HAD family hydrolase [Candidatus Sungbacteria bacterium]|uniref:HAD family hydrolase n=1 Tax=Candidatus Sungiibacteriota bacterium TaxID=2750080 RepID=A0A932R0Z9_9BACT|nr:HAD family hydrolase [Candidatus Sungbacteria bacterium]
MRRAKIFAFRYLRQWYLLLEIAEYLLHVEWGLHQAGILCLRDLRKRGMLMGIITDRSAFGFFRSVEKNDFPPETLDFVRVRRSIADFWSRTWPDRILFRSATKKDAPGGLGELADWFASSGFEPEEILLVGDDERDRRAAAIHGFHFVGVDRRTPDFSGVYEACGGSA